MGLDTLGRYESESWHYYLPDALGSVRQEIDVNGNVSTIQDWTPFGVAVSGEQSGLGYTGEWWDAAVGLQYLRARWYDPQTGRFTQVDPWPGYIQLPKSQYPYVYVWNNPVNLIDPSGLQVAPWNCELGQICVGGTTGPYNPQYPGSMIWGNTVNLGPLFYYDRIVAIAYATQHNCDCAVTIPLGPLGSPTIQMENAWNYFWGSDLYGPFLHANCTNFVSQALATGGLPMTDDWRWQWNQSRFPITTGCGDALWNSPCTLSWGYAPELRHYLVESLGFEHFVLDEVSREEFPDIPNIMLQKIERGDVVFYGEGYDHAALVLGWGGPTHYQESENIQPCYINLPENGISDIEQLPWIIDRDGPGYPRAFNDVGSPGKYRIEFVHIPDWVVRP